MSDFLKDLQKRTATEVETRVNAMLPTGMGLTLNPPENFEEEEEEEEEESVEDLIFNPEVPDDFQSLVFDDASDPEHNLSCAVAAWRLIGFPGCLVAQSPINGEAFCGTLVDLENYASQRDMRSEDFDMYIDSDALMDMEYDHDTLKQVLRMMDDDDEGVENSKKFFNKFHWGDHPSVISAVNVPGVTGNLTFLGLGRRIEYGSQKDNKWEEYYHLFGENSHKYPAIYAVSDPNNPDEKYPRTLVIHGGEMRVEGRGIVE